MQTIVQTFGEIEQNWIVELVADRERHDRVNLLYWDGTREQIQTTMTMSFHGGKDQTTYEPAEIDPSILRAIYLPDGVAPYGSTRGLFDSLCSALKKFALLPDQQIALLAHAVLASWVVESTDIPVSVALVGPGGLARRQLFRLLHCLFRRALILSTANLARLSALPMNLTPSLFIECCEPGAVLQAFLRTTSSREAHFAAKGRLLNFCCAKVFCTDDPLNHSLEGFPLLEISIGPGESSMPYLDYRAQKEILEEFQPKLLMYRLMNLALVRDLHFDRPGIDTSWRDVMDCLAASAASDAQLQASVTELIGKQEAAYRADSGSFFRKIVLEVLLTLCHRATENTLTVGEITRAANKLLEAKGEVLSLEARAVGDMLRALQIPTERLGAQGRGIVLLMNIRKRLHAIAMDHRINLRDTMPRNCQICLEIDPENDMQNPSENMAPEELDNHW
jgi:hypothetical protein